jgi:hypothetical protein
MSQAIVIRNKKYKLVPTHNGCENCAFYNNTPKCQVPESRNIQELCTPDVPFEDDVHDTFAILIPV